jgi:hypothetical protein
MNWSRQCQIICQKIKAGNIVSHFYVIGAQLRSKYTYVVLHLVTNTQIQESHSDCGLH